METTLTSQKKGQKQKLKLTDALVEQPHQNTSFELGLWLSGLESFLKLRDTSFADSKQGSITTRDWTKEFRLVNSALLLCSKLNLQLIRELKNEDQELAVSELSDFSAALIDSALITEALLRGSPLRFAEWIAWSNFLTEKLKSKSAFRKIILIAEKQGESFLPEKFLKLLDTKPIPYDLEADLRLLLPHFGKILKWLDAIGKILDKDEPLKPTALLFARIHEQTKDLMRLINDYLLRKHDEEDEFFAALDCAVYAISIELRKVYDYELVGFTESHQSPAIYARVETAHGLLNDSFQQTVVNLARLIEPEIDSGELFPNIERKLRNSLKLREDLWRVLQVVKAAEKDLEKVGFPKLYQVLNDFFDTSIRYLFFKDLETTERFIEEVLTTKEKRDLVPILHRFGTYLETLFEQVNMRAVLANHPFVPPEDSR
ncbi:MAG: hypothetical protein ACK419_00330 [Pyrinomonadaceae bacterium]